MSVGSSILRELLAVRGPAVCWLGNNGWLIRAGERLFAFDLDLNTTERMTDPPISAQDLAGALDALLITHEHGDHLRVPTAAILARDPRCRFIVPANCVAKAASAGIAADRITVARPREPFDLLDMRIEPMRAFHGHKDQTIHRNANLDDCGYLIDVEGLRIFQPGDTLVTQEHMALEGIDVMFVSPTIHNMHIRPAAMLIETLRPRWIFPQHFGTYTVTEANAFWTVGYPAELREVLSPDMRTRLHPLRQGEILRIDNNESDEPI